jgi:hypothetical protein
VNIRKSRVFRARASPNEIKLRQRAYAPYPRHDELAYYLRASAVFGDPRPIQFNAVLPTGESATGSRACRTSAWTDSHAWRNFRLVYEATNPFSPSLKIHEGEYFASTVAVMLRVLLGSE